MNDTRLAQLMRESTQDLPRRDLVPGALAGARRTRRRRGAAGVVAVAALVVAVVIGVGHVTGEPHTSPQPAGPRGGSPVRFAMPALDASISRGVLRPDSLSGLPRAQIGIPQTLRPEGAESVTPPERAVVVTADLAGPAGVIHALDADGSWHRVPVQAPGISDPAALRVEPGSLAPDGGRVALWSHSAAYVVDLASGATRRYPVPGVLVDPLWRGDSRHLLLTTRTGRSVEVDTTTGSTSPGPAVPLPQNGMPAVAYDGDVLVHRVVGSRRTSLVEQRGSKVLRSGWRSLADSWDFSGLVAGDGGLAMAAAPLFTTHGTHTRGQGTGLLVLDESTFSGRAWLPLRGPHGDDYTLGDDLLPRGWVGPHRLLFSVAPMRGSGGVLSRPTQDYLVWDTGSGQLSRVTSAPAAWRDSSWATGLLR